MLVTFFAFFSCDKNSDEMQILPQQTFEGKVLYSKTFGGSQNETAGGATATPDGGIIMVSTTLSNDGDVNASHPDSEIWVTRLDASGNIMWSKTVGGTRDDYGYSITATLDGNYVIAGYSASSDGDVPSNRGMHDFFVAKMTGSGNLMWTNTYGFSSHDHAHKIIATKDGGFFVAGYSDFAGLTGQAQDGDHGAGHGMRGAASTLHGVGEFMGIKIDANGTFMWYRYFGGTKNDRVNDIVECNDGGLIMVGYTESDDFDADTSKGSYDYWAIKLHGDGMFHWKKNYGGSGIDQAFAIAKTNNNSYLIAGRSNSFDGDISKPKGNFDAWIIHIDDEGKLLWDKSFGGADFDVASSIKKTEDGKFVVVGNTRGSMNNDANKCENDFWFFKIDNDANSDILWQKTFGGSSFDLAADVVVSNNEYTIIGDSQSSDLDVPSNRGQYDIWVLKVK